MDIRVSGHQIDTGAALQEHVDDRLNSIVDKYFSRAISSHVTFGKGPGGAFTADIVTHVMQGLILKGHAEAHDVHQAFDAAAAKIEKQLRRYKRRLKDHHKERAEPVELLGASSYILASDSDSDAQEPDTLQPMIIAEMQTKVPTLSVGEAVMQMELSGDPVLLFRKEGQEGMNVVYRREDGNIGWIDPS